MSITFGDSQYPEIYEAQRILNLLGLSRLGIDGIYGLGTQKAVMAFQHKSNLPVDGILNSDTFNKLKEALSSLSLTGPMPNLKIEQILALYKQKSYQINEQQYKINLLGIRKDDVFDNMFSDRLVIFWQNENMDWEKREFEWTTLAGTLGQGGVLSPLTVLGLTGVAALAEGQYVNAYQLIDTYHGWLNYPYFNQIGKVKIYRDNTRDKLIDYDSPTQNGLFGINIHRMSGNGQQQRYVNSDYAAWSQGCQGCPEPVFRQIIELARISSRFHGSTFTYTLAHRRDFPNSKDTNEEYFSAMSL